MTIQQYQIDAQRTCPDLGTRKLNYLHMNMGVNTEIAEAIDSIKKHIAYGKDLDVVNIQEELADACWYLANKATLSKQVLEEIKLNDQDTSIITPVELAELLINFITSYNSNDITTYQSFYHLSWISKKFGLDFYKGLDNNIAKLKIRFPDKFCQDLALNRDLESERIELEK